MLPSQLPMESDRVPESRDSARQATRRADMRVKRRWWWRDADDDDDDGGGECWTLLDGVNAAKQLPLLPTIACMRPLVLSQQCHTNLKLWHQVQVQ